MMCIFPYNILDISFMMTMGTGSFLGVKSGRGVTLTPHLLLVPLVMKV